MTYHFRDVDSIQSEGNSIIVFKPTEERRRDEIIREEVNQLRKLANNYLELRDSIDSFKVDASTDDSQEESNLKKNTFEPRKLDASIIRESKQEIIRNALKIVCDNLNAQTAAIFLISKDGVLERYGIYGVDKDGQSLDNQWFSEESYKVGESFTGKAAQSKEGTNYGEIQYAPMLSAEDLKPQCRVKYSEKFEKLKCAIAIPLNGRNRTYGVLRVINKIDKAATSRTKVSLSKDSFTEDDVTLLLFLATNISNTLSNFRRDVQVEILKYLSRLLIQPICPLKDYLKAIYKQAIDLLVQNPETAFKAGILRVKDDDSGFLEVEATSLAPGVTKDRDDNPRKPNDDEFLWITAEKQQRLILQDIQSLLRELEKKDQRIQFKNQDWIVNNDFQSFGCFPLVAKGETVGTFSLYTGYKYEFSPDSIDFLQGVADLLGSFIFNIKLEKQKSNLQENLIPRSKDLQVDKQLETEFKSLAAEWKKDTEFLSSTIQISIHPKYQRIIGLGIEVVPLILRELSQHEEPDHWFWALNAITGEDPVPPEHQGRLVKMKDAWIEWGKRRNYVFD